MISKKIITSLMIGGLLTVGLTSCGCSCSRDNKPSVTDKKLSTDSSTDSNGKTNSPVYIERIDVEVDSTQVPDVNPTIPKGMKAIEEKRNSYSCTVRYNYVEKSNDEIKTIIRLKASLVPNNPTNSELEYHVFENDIATVTQEDNIYFNVAFKSKGAFKFTICSTDGYEAQTTITLMYN